MSDSRGNLLKRFISQSLAIDLRYPGKETMELSTASILPTFEGWDSHTTMNSKVVRQEIVC